MVSLNGADGVVGSNHGHAAGKQRGVPGAIPGNGIDAEIGIARGIAVAERDGAGFPAAAIVAAPQRAHSVEELVVRVGGPVGRFAPARDDDTRAMARTAGARRDGGGEVHEAGDGAEDADAVMHEPDELAHIGLPAQIEHAAQGRVPVRFPADLHEEDASAEVIDHRLPAVGRPPFDGDIGLAARGDDPVRDIEAEMLDDLRRPRALEWMQVDVAAEFGGPDTEIESAVQALDESVDGVVRRAIALIEQRILALDRLALVVAEGCDPRIVQPKIVKGRAQIGEEFAGKRAVQIADRGGEQHDVAERIPAAEDEFLFSSVRMRMP